MDSSEVSCEQCHKKPTCKTICKNIQKVLNEDNPYLYEKQFQDYIAIFPRSRKEQNFSTLQEAGWEFEKLSSEDLKLSTDAIETSVTTVFVEIFFNRTPVKEVSERLGIQQKTVYAYFQKACDQIQKLVGILSSRKSSLRWATNTNFTKLSVDEKGFLLNYIFGFKVEEVSEILPEYSYSQWSRKIRSLEKKYTQMLES